MTTESWHRKNLNSRNVRNRVYVQVRPAKIQITLCYSEIWSFPGRILDS